MTTNLCLAAIAAGLFLVAFELRQLRLGRVDQDAIERWFQSMMRARQRILADNARREGRGPVKDY